MACRPDQVKRGGSIVLAARHAAADDEAGKPYGKERTVGRFGNGHASTRLRERRSGGGDKGDKHNGNKAEHAEDFQYRTLPNS